MNNGVVKILGSKQLQWLARISHKPLQGDDFPGKLEFEPAAMALIQLKEERISHFRAVSADLPKDSHGNEALQLHLQQISERKLHMQHVETRAFAPVLGLYDEYPRSIKEQEVSQKREPGQTSTCRPDSCSAPSSRSFLGGTTKDSLVETTYSLGGEKKKSRGGDGPGYHGEHQTTPSKSTILRLFSLKEKFWHLYWTFSYVNEVLVN